MIPKQKLIAVFVIILASALLTIHATSFAGSGVNMEEGLWEITAEMDMPGMAAGMAPTTFKQCITKESLVPRGTSPQNQKCKIIESEVSGDTVTWTMECDSPEGKVRSVGEITYSGDTFEGTIKMSMQGMEMIQYLSGRKIGTCTQ